MNTDESLVQDANSTIAINKQKQKQEQYKLLIKHIYSLSCFKHQHIENVTVIKTGLSQPCFGVQCRENAYCVKYLNNGSHELFANKLVQQHDISPKLVYGEDNWLVTEFLSGELLINSTRKAFEKLDITLSLLAQCHLTTYSQSAPTLSSINSMLTTSRQYIPKLNINEVVVELLKNCKISLPHAKNIMRIANRTLQEVDQQIKVGHGCKDVFCHGDANFSNIINSKGNASKLNTVTGHYKMIDFECACIAPIEYDIAMMMAVNEIDVSEIETVMATYTGHQRTFEQVRQTEELIEIIDELPDSLQTTHMPSSHMTKRYYILSLIINGLWYLSQYKQRWEGKYKVLAQQQFSLLARCCPDVNITV